MGFDHAILLIETHGNKIINLKIPGCRPCLSPDGKQIAWGPGDHEVAAAPIDLDSDSPAVGPWRLRVKDEINETYHVDWSPDSTRLAYLRFDDSPVPIFPNRSKIAPKDPSERELFEPLQLPP
jgi:hypothetical protein